jgi:membrane protease YdiL (CAAX protease family)
MAEPNASDSPPPDPPIPPELIPVLRPADDVPVLQPTDELPVPPPESGLHYEVPRGPSYLYFWAFLVVGGLFYVALLVSGGEARRFAQSGLESLPFLLLALFAYPGERREEMRLVTLLYWLVLVGLTAAMTLALTFVAVVDPSAFPPPPGEQLNLSRVFLPGGLVRLGIAALATLGAVVIGGLGFAPPLRQAMSHGRPFEPNSFVHAVALATVLAMVGILFVPLLVLGEPPLLALMRHFVDVADDDVFKGLADPSNLRDQIYATAWLVPAAIMAVGYPLYRTLPEALQRIGLVLPSVGQVLFGLLAAVIMVVVMTFFDFAVGWIWQQLGWPTTDAKQFEQLMKFAISPTGAVVIGVTAGLGEEVFARGVLQPRLGIVLANLFFTALHALQYNWDGLLSVFVIGLILGTIRKKTNTSTSAIMHGTYDCVLVLLTYYNVDMDPTKWFGH